MLPYISAAEIFLQDGFSLHAMGCYAQGVSANPDNIILKKRFLSLAASSRFAQFNPQVKALYLQCAQTENIDFSGMGASCYSLLQSDPVFGKVLRSLGGVNYQTFQKEFFRLPDPDAFLDPLFVELMKNKTMVPYLAYEAFLKNTRHMLLDLLAQDSRFFNKDDFIMLAEALAHYCFYTEYIFSCSEEEKQKSEALCAGELSEETLAVLACYMPLYMLENAAIIEERFSSSSIGDLVKLQITNYKAQQEIRKTIPSLTETIDKVSLKVKEQYEEFPYPRWVTTAKIMHDKDIEAALRGRKAEILVAGCGTGREAIELAMIFPDSHVLALDLSYASLAYGISKAQEFNVRNITFKQADILGLGGFGQRFDFIASSGVLHHMEDPEAGWDIVSGLLKSGGFMRLCLYSELSRRSLLDAQNIIKKKGYSNSASDLKRFRHDARVLLKERDFKKIINIVDFYSLSEFRDLLFHVCEHQYTLPVIKEWLVHADMRFVSFYISGDILQKYHKLFPQDKEAIDLDLWNEFEKKNPDTFIGMYRMLLQKV